MEAKSRPEPQIITMSSSNKTLTSTCMLHDNNVKNTSSSDATRITCTDAPTNTNEGKEQGRAVTVSPSTTACPSTCGCTCCTSACKNTSTTTLPSVSAIASNDLSCSGSVSASPPVLTTTATSSCSSSSPLPETLSSPSTAIDTLSTIDTTNTAITHNTATAGCAADSSTATTTTASTNTAAAKTNAKDPITDNKPIKPIKNNTKNATKSKKARQKSAQNLSNEMENYIYSNPRTTAYRAASYRPTLEKFQSVAFADYVRAVLLGVTVDGVEPEDPYYSEDSDSDSDQTNEEKSDTNVNKSNKKDDVKDVDKNDDYKDGCEHEKNTRIKVKCSSVDEGNDESKDDNHEHCKKNNCVQNGGESDMKKDGFCGNETVTTSNYGDETKNPFPVKTINTEKSEKAAIAVATVPSSDEQEQCPLQSSAIINQHQEKTTAMSQIKSSKQGKDSIETISCSNNSNIPTENTVKLKQEPTTDIRITRSSTRRMTTRLQTKSIPVPSSPEREQFNTEAMN